MPVGGIGRLGLVKDPGSRADLLLTAPARMPAEGEPDSPTSSATGAAQEAHPEDATVPPVAFTMETRSSRSAPSQCGKSDRGTGAQGGWSTTSGASLRAPGVCAARQQTRARKQQQQPDRKGEPEEGGGPARRDPTRHRRGGGGERGRESRVHSQKNANSATPNTAQPNQ